MAALALTTHPKYITTAGYGCIFSNFGLGPGEPEEPTIVTKFFSMNLDDEKSDAYYQEKVSHVNVVKKCGNFPTMSAIFGIDLNATGTTYVKGYPDSINVKSGNTAYPIMTKRLTIGYDDVSPSIVCETPNHAGNLLNNEVYSIPHGNSIKYPVIKMNNLGVDMFDNPAYLTLNSFIQSLELLALFHTGMIHNDMKGNNMLVSPLTGKLSLIDFGLCKPFDPNSPFPPYHERTFASIRQSWYAYPPEFTFLKSSKTEFRNPSIDISYTKEYIRSYDIIKAKFRWPFHFELNRSPGESDDERLKRINDELTVVYNRYFSPTTPGRLPDNYIFLQTAITGDTYTLGLESGYCYGENARTDGLNQNPSISNTDVHISSGKILTGNIFIMSISFLLTSFNPRYRPFHINILKLYKHYNRKLVQGASTIIKAGGIPYTELSILNGSPATIDVKPNMCLGMAGCPIPEEDVTDNLKLLYFFLQQDMFDMVNMLYDDHSTYTSLLADANAFIVAERPSLFFPVILPLPVSAVAKAAVTLRKTIPDTPPGTPPGSPPRVPLPHVVVPVIHPFFKVPRLPPLGRPILGGMNPYELLIGILAEEAVVKNLIEAGLLAPGVYISALKKSSDTIISNTLRGILLEPHIQEGGFLATTKTVAPRITFNTSPKKSNRSKNTKKLNRKVVNLNVSRRNRANVNIKGYMPVFTEIQIKAFFNEIMTSTTPGRLNILYSYYVSHLPITQQKIIMSLLFFVPLANPDVIETIMTQLASSNSPALIDYLKTLKTDHVSEVGASLELDVAKAEIEVDALVNRYIEGSDARYISLLNKFAEMSEQMVKLTNSKNSYSTPK